MRGYVVAPLLLAAVSGICQVGSAATPFTLIAVPDPQNYTNNTSGSDPARNNTIYFKGQMNWIVANKAKIPFVMMLGDMQNPGNPYRADPENWYQPKISAATKTTDPADETFWMRADSAVDILDAGGVGYSLAPGNHDYLNANNTIEPIYWLKWFGPTRFINKPTYRGASPEVPGATPGDMPASYAGMNTWHVFEAGGRKYMNIVLQFAPSTADLRWAQSIVNQNPGMPTIVTTHAMLDTNGYQAARQNIWDDFAKNNPQIVMMMNGHITGAFKQSPANISGQATHQMLVDYQATEFEGLFRGGGYLRTMEVDTDNSVVRVKSYSPIDNSYLTDGKNQFNLPLDINGRFGAAAGLRPSYVRKLSFRDGENGYTGTRDTQIDGTTGGAGTEFSGQEFIWVDGDAGNGADRQALLKFTGLVQSGRIPSNAVIKRATVTLTTDTATDSQSTSSMSMYRMMKAWAETDTWTGLGGGIGNDGNEAILAANDTVTPSVVGGKVTFDVTESVFTWAQGATIQGWVIRPGGNNGWRFVSSEASDISKRPLLEVEYLVAATFGDANVDERITADDFALIDRGRAKGLTGWANGDFNGDGAINAADYLLMDVSYGQQQGGLGPEYLAMREGMFGSEYVEALVVGIPEPACAWLVAGGACVVARRRR